MDFRDFKNIKEEYLPGAVWEWCALPTAEEIDASLQAFSEKEITSIVIRPLPSLAVKYCGDDYFELIRTAARRSVRHGIKLWIWDENSSSAGSGGGEIVSVPDYRAKFIMTVPSAEVRKDDTVLCENNGKASVIRLDNSAPPAADIFSSEVGQCFAEAIYDNYRHNCSRFIGNEICGFLSYINIDGEKYPYNKEVFGEQTIAFENTAELTAKLDAAAEKNFACILGENCRSHGLAFSVNTGGSILSRQRYRAISDEPYTFLDTENPDYADIKLLTSLCVQLGKKACLHIKTPTFGKTHKRRGGAALAAIMGANRIFYDGVPYSYVSKQKYLPGKTSLLKNSEQEVSHYWARLARIVNETESKTDALLVFPTEDMSARKGAEYKEAYAKINQLCKNMLLDGVSFHMADEYMLTKHAVWNETLKIGTCSYSKLIVPEGMTLSSSVGKLLEAFGGEIIYAQLQPCEHKINIKADGEVFLSYIYNEGKECCMAYFPKECSAQIYCGEALTLADCTNGEVYELPLDENGISVRMSGGSCLVLGLGEAPFAEQLSAVTDGALWKSFENSDECAPSLCGADENILPLKNVNACFGKKSARDELVDNLYDRFLSLPEGETVKLKYPFYISQTGIESIDAYIENANNMEEILLNGKPVSVRPHGYGFYKAEIGELLAFGKNTFSLEYKKSSKYLPDNGNVPAGSFAARGETSMEAIYLCGDFDTDGEKIIVCDLSGENVADGAMPYYYGELKYALKLPEEINGGVLEINGGFDLCRIKVGKRESVSYVSPARIELFSLDASAVVEITVENTPKNLFSLKSDKKEAFGISSAKILHD